MPVGVPPSDAEERHPGPQGIEPRGPRTATRPVVAHLQDLHLPDPIHEHRLGRPADVSGEQEIERPVTEVHHERILVRPQLATHPPGRRMQHRQRDPVHDEGVSRPRRLPFRSGRLHRIQVLRVEGRAEGLARLEDETDGDRIQHRRYPPKVIRVAV